MNWSEAVRGFRLAAETLVEPGPCLEQALHGVEHLASLTDLKSPLAEVDPLDMALPDFGPERDGKAQTGAVRDRTRPATRPAATRSEVRPADPVAGPTTRSRAPRSSPLADLSDRPDLDSGSGGYEWASALLPTQTEPRGWSRTVSEFRSDPAVQPEWEGEVKPGVDRSETHAVQARGEAEERPGPAGLTRRRMTEPHSVIADAEPIPLGTGPMAESARATPARSAANHTPVGGTSRAPEGEGRWPSEPRANGIGSGLERESLRAPSTGLGTSEKDRPPAVRPQHPGLDLLDVLVSDLFPVASETPGGAIPPDRPGGSQMPTPIDRDSLVPHSPAVTPNSGRQTGFPETTQERPRSQGMAPSEVTPGPTADPHELADLINQVLAEQARRNGVDLS